MKIVLASQSPRRREILKLMGLDFTVIPAKDEKNPEGISDPAEYTSLSALYKAENVAAQTDAETLVIGADTVVVLDGEILGKPHSEAEAVSMLSRLQGRSHTVYTGYALIMGERKTVGFESSEVEFMPMTAEEIKAYVATGEPMDKAGAYGIQGLGCVNIKKINGDYFNVVGLPASKIYSEIKKYK